MLDILVHRLRGALEHGVKPMILVGAGLFLATTVSAQSPGMVEASGGQIMEQRCSDEVIQLHQFFEDWFNGVLPPTEAAFERFSSVLADDFVIISPSGELTEREELLVRLEAAHGIWRENRRPGRIWIENLRVRHQVGDQVLVLYEEWQEIEGESRGRLSTALFERREDLPNGVEWIHVHEVWLPNQG